MRLTFKNMKREAILRVFIQKEMGVFNMDRVFAMDETYLNDWEEGGSTYFPHFDLRIKPEKEGL